MSNKWEFVLVLLIIVTGILITTIIALKWKGKLLSPIFSHVTMEPFKFTFAWTGVKDNLARLLGKQNTK